MKNEFYTDEQISSLLKKIDWPMPSDYLIYAIQQSINEPKIQDIAQYAPMRVHPFLIGLCICIAMVLGFASGIINGKSVEAHASYALPYAESLTGLYLQQAHHKTTKQ